MRLSKVGVLREGLLQQKSPMRTLPSHLRWLWHVDRASEDRLQSKTYVHQEEGRRRETALDVERLHQRDIKNVYVCTADTKDEYPSPNTDGNGWWSCAEKRGSAHV